MKKISLFTVLILWQLCVTERLAATQTTVDDKFFGWTDEQYKQYEDSIFAAIYPPVIAHKNNISISEQENNHQRIRKNDVSVPPTITVDKTKGVGQIPIISGTLCGAKTYEVPIEIYHSARDFQPSISLVYNSYLGNDILGSGWSLSGVSTITRGGKSIYFDDNTQGVIMDNSDSFSLDGMRLIKRSATDTHIMYESEQGNIRVVGHISGSVMKYFEVFYPNGNKGIFGFTSNSSNRLQYPVTSLKDQNNATINYSYSLSENNYYIEKINYNGASIDFDYINRADTIISFTGGLKVCKTKLIRSITPKFTNREISTYEFDYIIQNSKSFLVKIDYSANGESLNPLRFYYGNGITTTSFDQETTRLIEWYTCEDPNRIRVAKGKFDYESGVDGLIMLPNENPYWKHYRSSSLTRHSQNRFDNYYTGSEKIFLFAGLKDSWADPMPNLYTESGFIDILCADLAGKQEEYIIKINNSVVNDKDQITFKIYKSNLHAGITQVYTRTYSFPTVYTDADGGKSVQPKFYYTGDFNGDGKIEVMAVSVHEPFGDSSKPSNCYIFDLIHGSFI